MFNYLWINSCESVTSIILQSFKISAIKSKVLIDRGEQSVNQYSVKVEIVEWKEWCERLKNQNKHVITTS